MATNGFETGKLNIRTFTNGINESVDDTLVKFYETTRAYNVENSKGTLKPLELPVTIYSSDGELKSVANFYGTDSKYMLLAINGDIYKYANNSINSISTNQNNILDSLCFENQGERISVIINGNEQANMFNGTTYKRLKNRRPYYNEETGNLECYYDANGKRHDREDTVTTYAPQGKFCELHYDRLWIAGDSENPDRVYFSTADRKGFDIQDFTMPIDEEEANMHGGFVDVPSFDGGKIIGLKVIFNDLVIFKDKTIFKIFGNNPSNYQIVQLFNTSGAICDKSIATGNNGAYFLNNDGIHFYDGTNTNVISQKIEQTISKIDLYKAQEIACSTFYNGFYYLSVPLKGSDANNCLIRLDSNTGAFMIYNDLNIKAFNEFDKKLYMISDNKLLCNEGSNKYMNMLWETPFSDLGYKNAKKRSEYIYFIAEGDGTLNIECITDKKTKEISIPISGETSVYKKKLKNKGRIFKLKFSTKDGKYINVTSPELILEVDVD